MRTQFNIIVLILISFVVIASSGCGETATNTSNLNANVANANAKTPVPGLNTTKTPEAATTNNAPTLSPVVHAYYDALKRKDAAAVRKVMAEGFISSTEEGMKEEKKTDLIAFLTEFDKLPADKMEVRNEQISGAKGTAELKGGSYGDWVKFVFRNEGGTWKITNEIDR